MVPDRLSFRDPWIYFSEFLDPQLFHSVTGERFLDSWDRLASCFLGEEEDGINSNHSFEKLRSPKRREIRAFDLSAASRMSGLNRIPLCRLSDSVGPVCPQKLPDISNEEKVLERMPKGRLKYLKRLLPHLRNQSEDCLYLNIYAPAMGE